MSDEFRDLARELHDAADRAPVDPDALAAALPAMRREVRRRRTVRGLGVAGVSVAAVAVLAVAATALPGLFDDDAPVPPATPSPTQSPTDGPTQAPTDEPTGEPTGEAIVGSEPVQPVCGEPFALPDRPSQLALEASFPEPVAFPADPAGLGTRLGAVVELTNRGEAWIDETTPYEAQLVVVGLDGAVVAAYEDPDIGYGEGTSALAVAPGDTFELSASLLLDFACGETAPTDATLPPGEYEVYGLLPAQGDGDLQGQGGPWPLTVVDGQQPEEWPTPERSGQPEGAVPWTYECGAAWEPPAITTGFTLEAEQPIRSPRPATDHLEGFWSLTTTQELRGPTVFGQVVLVQDGRAVSEPLPGGDAVTVPFASPDGAFSLLAAGNLVGCDGSSLPPGGYEVHVVALLIPGDAQDGEGEHLVAVAVSDVESVTIE
ncbi:hypothetical protein Bcav_0632 [Beutenbergia cavernae DSM 12333]|uniref:Uncharacterized protein n=1 Tax=Beutenbergia cavernae (strain ATCC BAA-8 / DSM 12333 / CCUG 43141 / JCM 11478 / NBRC 16432 / NCIMB 13614 / HKI 0122) TaxID=471853 RepID=C5BY00_BEUC1|nr:hypothetical protein [Beutenbergia cavernae]ACQ78894.1 hypothetical protein Bcav_0632 [Beutenbergia cavernae DSM 12333]